MGSHSSGQGLRGSPLPKPVTQLRRNGSCCPGGVGARQATQPSHRSLGLRSGKNNGRPAAVCTGATPRCVLWIPVRRGTKEGVILQLSAMPPGSPSPASVLTHPFWSYRVSQAAPYPSCTCLPMWVPSYLNSATGPQPKYWKGREQWAAQLLTIFQLQTPLES